MKALKILVGLVALTATTATATELQLTSGSQHFNDPAYGLVSDGPNVPMLGVRVAQPVSALGGLSVVGAIETGATDHQAWGFDSGQDTSVDARLRMTALDAGIRVAHPLGRFIVPYASLTARATVGALRVEDGITGWSYADPSDPTGESVLYEVDPERQLGWSLGVQGTAGVQLRFGGQKKGDVATGVGNGGDVCGRRSNKGDEAEGDVAPVTEPRRERRAWGSAHPFGLFFEGGYAVQTGLRFQEAGNLGLGGMRLLGGAFIEF